MAGPVAEGAPNIWSGAPATHPSQRKLPELPKVKPQGSCFSCFGRRVTPVENASDSSVEKTRRVFHTPNKEQASGYGRLLEQSISEKEVKKFGALDEQNRWYQVATDYTKEKGFFDQPEEKEWFDQPLKDGVKSKLLALLNELI